MAARVQRHFSAALRLAGTGALLAAGLVAGAAGAAAQEGDSPLIDAEVVADIGIEGGDAQGGNAQGGDAGLSATVIQPAGGGDVHVNQEGGVLEGGDAVGGDAQGGDGLNAFVDAEVVLDADVALDVAADVNVDTVAGADLDLSGQAVSAQPVDGAGDLVGDLDLGGAGNVTDGLIDTDLPGTGRAPRLPDLGGATGGLDQTAGGATDALGGVLGGLGGLNLLDLFLDAEIQVIGGDAAGGDAAAGDALIQAAVVGGPGGAVNLNQEASTVLAGDATGGASIGGDGIELDVLLDADIDLIVDANVDVAADVDTAIEGNLRGRGGLGLPAQLGLFESR